MIHGEYLEHDVWLMTIDRHERRNALDVAHLDALREQLHEGLRRGARAVVITGAGTAFSGGADLNDVYGDTLRRSLYATLNAITQAAVPVLAAVNGPAIGAGTQLAIACDLRVGADGARFAVPTGRNGLAVNPWTIRRLALLTNGSVARALLLGGGSLGTDEALRLGLLTRMGGLDGAIAWAREIAAMAPLSVNYSKQALNLMFEAGPSDFERAPADLDSLFERCWQSRDAAEGQLARRDGRTPVFEGK